MWKSFVLELHGEWSEFADECFALKSTVGNRIGRIADPWQTSHYQSEFDRPARFKNSKSAQRFCRNLEVRRGRGSTLRQPAKIRDHRGI